MKIAITITTIALVLILAGTLASPVNAVQIEPLPTAEGTNIGDLINTIYKNALGLGGIAALVMITIGAVYFTLSGASPDKQSEGRDYIASALWGLLLLFGAFIILNTINPQITELAAPGEGYAENVEEVAVGGNESARDICIGLFNACKSVYGRFYESGEGYILKSRMEVPVFNCGTCVDSIKTKYETMATGAEIQPWLLMSDSDNLIQGCAVLYWDGGEGDVTGAEILIAGVGPNENAENVCSVVPE